MKLRKHPLEQVDANAALGLLERLALTEGYALTYVDSLGVIERRKFAEVAREAAQWASLLRKHGIQPGDRVVILAERDRSWCCALLGVLQAGAVAVPCPGSTPPAEIRAIAAQTDAQLFVSVRARPRFIASEVPIVSGDDVDSRAEPVDEAAHESRPEDVALILYMGDGAALHGSVHTHASLCTEGESEDDWLGIEAGERVWSTAREGSAESISLLLAAWRRGAEIVIVDCETDPRGLLELLDRFRPAAVWFADDDYGVLASAAHPAWAEEIAIRRAFTSDPPGVGAVEFERVFRVTLARGAGANELSGPGLHRAAAITLERIEETQPEVPLPPSEAALAATSLVPDTVEKKKAPSAPHVRFPKDRGGEPAVGDVGRVVPRVVHARQDAVNQLGRASLALARPLPGAFGALMRSAVHGVGRSVGFVRRGARQLALVRPPVMTVLRRSLNPVVRALPVLARFLRVKCRFTLAPLRAAPGVMRTGRWVRRSEDRKDEEQQPNVPAPAQLRIAAYTRLPSSAETSTSAGANPTVNEPDGIDRS